MRKRLCLAAGLVLLLHATTAAAQLTPAKPLEPIAAITNAFRTHDIVALGEGMHNNVPGARFRQRLLHDRRFQRAVNDIVVESGNAYYQPLMDRYIAGEDVPEKELRKAWLITTQDGTVWDAPIYAETFRAVREINRILPKSHQLRVLLNDQPYVLDDASTHGPRTHDFPFAQIKSEVLAKHRKALLIYGDFHLSHDPPQRDYSLVAMLDDAGVKVFSIWAGAPLWDDLTTLQPSVARWPNPSLALIKGTPLGQAPFAFYDPNPPPAKGASPGPMAPRGPMENAFDAILYLGTGRDLTYAAYPRTLCDDEDYLALRSKRMNLSRDAFRARCLVLAQPNQGR